MSRIVAPRREWISSVNNLRLDAATSWMKVIPCTDSAVQGNDFQLIPMIRMERGHSVEGSFSREFHLSISLGSYRPLKLEVICDVIKKRPLVGRFWKFCSERFTTLQIHVLYANFVKFVQPEIGKVVRYLVDKKNKNSARSLALASMRIAHKICQGQRQTMYS